MKTMALWLALLSAPLAASSHAQEVWRCGADGRSYTSTACGEGRLVAVNAPRPAADVQAAQAVAVREAALADRLRRERLQQQAQALGSGTGSMSAGNAKTALKPSARSATVAKREKTHRLAIAGTSPAAARASRRTPG